MIDESNNCLTALLHHEGWTRNDAIIPNMACLLAGVDFEIYRLDIDFIVVNVIIGPSQSQPRSL